MKLLRRYQIVGGQAGFTLVEMLIALVITGIIFSGGAVTLSLLVRNTAPTNNRANAVNSVQSAADWITRDARNSENVTLNSNYPAFTWHDYGFNDNAHKTSATYSLVGNKLTRTFQYGVQAASAQVAAYNTSLSSASFSSGILTLTITATVGSGSQQENETKIYKIALRNYPP